MSAAERAAWLDRVAEEDQPPELEEWSGPDDELTAADLANAAAARVKTAPISSSPTEGRLPRPGSAAPVSAHRHL